MVHRTPFARLRPDQPSLSLSKFYRPARKVIPIHGQRFQGHKEVTLYLARHHSRTEIAVSQDLQMGSENSYSENLLASDDRVQPALRRRAIRTLLRVLLLWCE